MAIKKNFIVKNGFESSTDLIFADADTRKVGIGTTNPLYSLHVSGGIGVTDLYVSGISTFTNGPILIGSGTSTGIESQRLQVTGGTYVSGSVGIGTINPTSKLHVDGNTLVTGISTVLTELRVGTGGTVFTVLGVGNSIGIGTASPAYLLDIRSPVSTGQTAVYIQGDVTITGDLSVDDIILDDATLSNLTVTEALNVPITGIGTITIFNSSNGTITNLTGTSGTITTFNSSTGTITNLTGTAGTITTLNSSNGTITNLTGTAGTITTLNSSNGTITNLTGTAGTITTLNSSNGTITNLTGTSGTITTFNSSTGTITNLAGTNVSYSGIGTIVTFNSSNGTITNITGTAGTITTLNSSTGTITNITGTAGTITTLDTTNLTGTAGTITTFNSSTGNITNLTGTSGTITTFNSSNGTITNLTGTAGTITTLDTTNLTGTAGTITTFNSSTGTITNLTGTAGTITTLNSSNGTITNLTGTAGTITTLNSSTGTITNLTGTAGTITDLSSTNINVSGISTLGNTVVGGATTQLIVTGNARITGIVTIGTSSITLDGINDRIIVGGGLTITSSEIIIGPITFGSGGLAATTGFIANLSSTNLSSTNINASGIVTATTVKVGTGITINSTGIDAIGIITATSFHTGAEESAIRITSNTITGPATIIIDPAGVGVNTGAVRIKGDLYVDGNEFVVNSTLIELGDFNVGIATTVGTNALLDGAGIGIGSTGIRKTLTWDNSSTALKSSENFDTGSGKEYKIAGTSVLNSTTLGSSVVNSSLTSVGTLGSLNVSGISTLVGDINIGTGGTIAIFDSAGIVTIESLTSTNILVEPTGQLIFGGVGLADSTGLNVNGIINGNLLSANYLNIGVAGTIATLNSTNGTITNLTSTDGTIINGIITNGTITNLTGTSGTITTFNSTNLTGTSGTITTLDTTNLTGTAGTITTFNSTNLTGTSGTITTFNSSNGTITNLTTTNLNATGVTTIATLTVIGIAVTDFTASGNVFVAGIGTITTLNSSGIDVSGILTVSNGIQGIGIQSAGVNITTGILTALNFIGSGSSFTYHSGTKTIDIDLGSDKWDYVDETSPNTSDIYRQNGNVGFGITIPTSKLHVGGNTLVTGISTFTNGPVIIGAATSTGTASQRLQVTGGAYVSGSVGIGTTSPLGILHVGAASTQSVVVTGTGSVSVGHTSPFFAVDVSGDTRVRSEGKMRFGGTTGSTNFYIQYNSTTNSLDFIAG